MEADQGVVLGESHPVGEQSPPLARSGRRQPNLLHIEDHRSRRIDKRAAIAKAATDVGAESQHFQRTRSIDNLTGPVPGSRRPNPGRTYGVVRPRVAAQPLLVEGMSGNVGRVSPKMRAEKLAKCDPVGIELPTNLESMTDSRG